MKKMSIGIASSVVLVLTAACGSSGSEESNASDGPDQVSVNSLEILSLGPMMVADEKGFFEKHDIEVSFDDADIYARLAVQSQGDLDVNIPGVGGAFFNAINGDLNVVAVADRQQYRCASDNLLLARTEAYEAGLTSVKDLAGKKVAILAKGSTTEYWLDRALEAEGMTQDDLGEIVTLGYPDTVNALKTGAVDAGFLVQPLAIQMIKDGEAQRLLAMNEVVPDQEQGLITMSTQFIEERPDVAARWMAGWLEGVRFYQDPANEEEVVQIIADRTKVPAETISELYGTDQWPYMNPNGEVDTDTVMTQDAEWMLDNGVIEEIPAPEVWYDDSVVKAAQEIVGTVDADRDCSGITQLGS